MLPIQAIEKLSYYTKKVNFMSSVILIILGITLFYLHYKSWEGWTPGPGFNPNCDMCDWGLDYGFDNGCKRCEENGYNRLKK